MNAIKTIIALSLVTLCFDSQSQGGAITPTKKIILFNGKNLDGWEGNKNIWSVRDGVITAGNKTDKQPQNEFLSTVSSYKNYELELKFKIVGYGGFINAGIQLHSQRLADPAHEMTGFQADIGSDCMGSLYDESRRNKYLAQVDQKEVPIKKDWNTYRMVCKENTITLYINGKQTISYTEADSSVSMSGKIGLQIHGGGVLEVF
jgi:Domain of Unknown Function (DUF1080)